ncbi:unnamed protein product [Prunus armeniaca]|uniref:FAR1 domain-containing protein n=1 Tax=Prunus armeniaca TaxID=36596 RepID=A0A6J5U7N8_PRUAR|nr:unnamed protein product [Prunus armeniaca]
MLWLVFIDVESDEENVREKDPMIVNRIENIDEDLLGRVVSTEEEAYNLYNNYATRVGFSVRRGQKRYNTKKVSKLETRTGCEASIRFAFQDEDDTWKVSHFVPEHNHELAKPEERQFLRSNRKVSDSNLGVIKTMVGAGIRTTNTYSYLAEEVGGSQNVGFTKRDCYNVVNKEKMAMIEAGDAQSLMNLFKRKQAEDPMFFYTVQVDQENRMTNFFWRDGRSRIDYDCFGDVVVFDTTYRTNRQWQMAFKTFFLGCVIVYARGTYLRMLQEIWEVITIPEQYILKRWTKDAKKELEANEHGELLQVNGKSSVTLRRNALMRTTYDVLSKAAETEATTRIAMEKLREMEELIEKEMITSKGEVNKKTSDNVVDCNASGCTFDETPVLNPPCVRPKGISNARLKSAMEKRRKRTSKDTVSSRKTKQSSKIGRPYSSAHTPLSSNFLNPVSVPMSTNISNHVYPTMRLLPTEGHANLPQPNLSFTSMLQSTNFMALLNKMQESFTLGNRYLF